VVCGFFKKMFTLAGLPESVADIRARLVYRELLERYYSCGVRCEEVILKYGRRLSDEELFEMCKKYYFDLLTRYADCTEVVIRNRLCVVFPKIAYGRTFYPRYFFTDREKAGRVLALIKAILDRQFEHDVLCLIELKSGEGVVTWPSFYQCAVGEPHEWDWRRVGRARPVGDLRREISKTLSDMKWLVYDAAEGYVLDDAVVLFDPSSVLAMRQFAAAWLLFGGVYTPWPAAYVAVGESAYRFAKALLNLYKAWEGVREELRRLGEAWDSPKVRRIPEMYSRLAERADDVFDDFAAELLTKFQLWGHPTVVTLETGIEEYKTYDVYWRNIKR